MIEPLYILCIQFLQQVFSIDTIMKPPPPSMTYDASHNLNFITCICTQFIGRFWLSFAFMGVEKMENSINYIEQDTLSPLVLGIPFQLLFFKQSVSCTEPIVVVSASL